MPRADNLPSFATEISEVPASTHPLGIRPGGEGGTAGALAAVGNAIVDALKEFGVEHIELPRLPRWSGKRSTGRPDKPHAYP
jgi:carbon-monoxide dehydrogenase large subunit